MYRRRRRGQGAHVPPPKKIGENIFGQLLCKMWEFSGKNNVKFGYFVNFSANIIKFGYLDNFSGKNHVKFGHFNLSVNFFSGKNVVPPKVD